MFEVNTVDRFRFRDGRSYATVGEDCDKQFSYMTDRANTSEEAAREILEKTKRKRREVPEYYYVYDRRTGKTTKFYVKDLENYESKGFLHILSEFGERGKSPEVYKVSLSKPDIDHYEWWEYTYETICTDYEVSEGDKVYVLTLLYSDGDSFGIYPGQKEVIWAFKTHEAAKEAAKTWEADHKLRRVIFKLDTGATFQLGSPICKVFGTFEGMTITPIKVEG